MESLTFKGSVREALAEAKDKKKLLLVYFSGKKVLLFFLDLKLSLNFCNKMTIFYRRG